MQHQDKLLTLQDLPLEMLLEIFRYLCPEDIARVAPTSKHLRVFSKDISDPNLPWQVNAFWHNKGALYFAEQEKDENKRAVFIKTYQKAKQTFLQSLVKEGDIERLEENVTYSDLSKMDLVNLAKKTGQKHIVTCFYNKAENFFSHDETIDVTKEDEEGRTIFYWAIYLHQPAAKVRSIINLGKAITATFDVKAFSEKMPLSPIALAIDENCWEIILDLIQHNDALITYKNAGNKTLLMSAAMKGRLDVVEYLLNKLSLDEINALTNAKTVCSC